MIFSWRHEDPEAQTRYARLWDSTGNELPRTVTWVDTETGCIEMTTADGRKQRRVPAPVLIIFLE